MYYLERWTLSRAMFVLSRAMDIISSDKCIISSDIFIISSDKCIISSDVYISRAIEMKALVPRLCRARVLHGIDG